jgi:hypothetical protein
MMLHPGTRPLASLALLAAIALSSCSHSKPGDTAAESRDPAARRAQARTLNWSLAHRPVTLQERVLRHRARVRSGVTRAVEVLPFELSGEDVSPVIRANTRKRIHPTQVTHYNPATPVTMRIGGQETRVLVVRAEAKGSERSHLRFFEVSEDGSRGTRIVDARIPALDLQDPSVTIESDGSLYICGVEIRKKSETDETLSYRHVIYRASGRELTALSREPVFAGEWGKKGTRFKRLRDGRMLVVSRPQGEVGGRGKIAWSVVTPSEGESFQQLLDRGIRDSKLIEGQVTDLEWEGPNQLFELADGTVLFLAHQAAYTGGARRKGGEAKRVRPYVSTQFRLDPVTGKSTEIEVILERKDLPGGVARGAKRVDLAMVDYTSGLETHPDGSIKVNEDGTLTLWFGEGDLLIGRAKIANFLSPAELGN